ncbi:MAG: hypothetical protein KIT62_01700 [Cyclobacteriaceae bacterium]|nr:hypothetical protein [Cyclobacteriaceae bacterium]
MKTKITLLALTLIFSCGEYAIAQQPKPVSDIDFVRIKNGKTAEAMFYYENNWKVFRQRALEKGYIKSFKLLRTQADSLADFHIVLITEYSDSIQYKAKEENFMPIIREVARGGPKLLNELKPRDFVTVVFSKKAITEFED